MAQGLNPFLRSSDRRLEICLASKSRRTISPSNDVALETITYEGSVPMQRSSLGYQTLCIADLKGLEFELET